MAQPLAYLDGQMLPQSEVRIPLDDLGFMLGVTVSEQLRTFGGRLFERDDHLTRLAHSLKIVGLGEQVSTAALAEAAVRVVAHNHPLLSAGDDLALSILVTPGKTPSAQAGRHGPPRVVLHSFPLGFSQWAEKYERGESLAVTSIRQVPAECWPPELKCRSRMHYYLADAEAAERHAGARALLLNAAGHVTEATTANVLVYRRDEGIIVPPQSTVLPGISLAMVAALALRLQIPWREQPLAPADVAAADEVMLSSTPFCLLPVVTLDGQRIGDGTPGPIYRRLLAAWSDEVQLDIAAQARAFARR